MSIRLKVIFVFIFCSFFITNEAYNQQISYQSKEDKLTRILFVFDASNSMYGRWQSDTKINIAKRLLSEILDSLNFVPNVELALRVYGHQSSFPPQDCDDTELVVPFSPNNAMTIKKRLNEIIPKGTTLIAKSLLEAGHDFPVGGSSKNIIILITDGIEECGGDPCEISQALQEKGVFLKPFIIGLGKDLEFNLDCAGTYYDASSEENFKNALNAIITQTLNKTTAQVNLLDQYSDAEESNVNMTFYNAHTGQLLMNLVHTMNARGVPDTLILDPLTTYKIKVNTIPPVVKDSIKIKSGKHTIIPIDVPQGGLEIKYKNKTTNPKYIPAIVRENKCTNTLNIQYVYELERYITGKYDLEILTLPRIYLKDVQISQSKTTIITIDNPGFVNITKSSQGYGSLYVLKGKDQEWIYNLNNGVTNEIINLQPGTYKIVFRSRYANNTYYTIETIFEIESGRTNYVKVKK